MKLRGLIVGAVLGVVGFATGATVTTSGQISITIFNPLTISFSPSSPLIPCNAAAGTLVSTATFGAGDGNTIVPSATGDTGDFALGALSGNSVPIEVGPNGINPSHCPVPPALTSIQNLTVSGTQP